MFTSQDGPGVYYPEQPGTKLLKLIVRGSALLDLGIIVIQADGLWRVRKNQEIGTSTGAKEQPRRSNDARAVPQGEVVPRALELSCTLPGKVMVW